MRGQKVITFPFEFEYSHEGQFKKEFGITVRAPGIELFNVHNKMIAFASEAEVGLAIKFSRVNRDKPEAADEEEAKPKAPETDEEMVQRVIGAYSMGLGSEAFPNFMLFLKTTLTNNSRLATIGDTKIPVTDLVWNAIDNAGGMDAINMILRSFAGFFLKQPDSQASEKANGSNSPPTLRLVPEGH